MTARPDNRYTGGEHRARYAELFDAELRPHNERLRATAAVRPTDQVLDIGCGTGQTTRQAAQAATEGGALGVDISAPLLEYARSRTAREGPPNARYLQADAQTYPFPRRHFDLAISRYGVMFFADPVAAFGNIRAALRPDGRLVLLVWQTVDRNEWSPALLEAVSGDPGTGRESVAFSLGDAEIVTNILTEAGFTSIELTDVDEPVCYGPDVDTALTFVSGLRNIEQLMSTMDEGEAERARRRLRDVLAAHHTEAGVQFDSRSWLVTAVAGSVRE